MQACSFQCRQINVISITRTSPAGHGGRAIFAAQRHFRSSPRRSKLDFEIFVFSFATDFKKVVRVGTKLSGMSGSIIHFPQVHLSHLKNSYGGKKSEHRSELVPSARRNLSSKSIESRFEVRKSDVLSNKKTKIHLEKTMLDLRPAACIFHK